MPDPLNAMKMHWNVVSSTNYVVSSTHDVVNAPPDMISLEVSHSDSDIWTALFRSFIFFFEN